MTQATPPRRIRRKAASDTSRVLNFATAPRSRAPVSPARRSMRANKTALHALKRGIGGEVDVTKRAGAPAVGEPLPSQVTGEDPFSQLEQQGLTVEPPFDMLTLTTLPEHNSELTQIIQAMEMNIEMTGHRFVSRVDVMAKEVSEKLKADVRKEHIRLQNFFAYCTNESFPEFRQKLRNDKETTGCCYFEVVRDTLGNITSFTHMPSYQVRLGRQENDPVLTDRKILELQEDGSVAVATIQQWRRFRMFVQSRYMSSRGLSTMSGGYKVRWFKEFGDRREYSSTTGLELKPEELEKTPPKDRANEVVYMRLYNPRTPYGVPRYIGNLLSIFGDRACEEINYVTFRNNNIPSMAILVSNGLLTEGTVKRVESFVESQIQGSDNYSKFLIMEAESVDQDGVDTGNIKIDIKPLTSDQHKDALFQNYSANNQDKIRRAYRLPPIFVGRSDDYTRSTAESSRRLADEQVFGPERFVWDELINRWVFPEMGFVFHKYKSNTPNTTDNEQLVRILAGAEKTGGMTPRIARMMLEEILGQTLPGFKPYDPKKAAKPVEEGGDPSAFDPDAPFSLSMAAAVKNEAEPTEPGQQVTALKALGILDTDENGEVVVTKALLDRLEEIASRVSKLESQPDAAE